LFSTVVEFPASSVKNMTNNGRKVNSSEE
jgi:hypothetical protein